jgi:hypothetical protein
LVCIFICRFHTDKEIELKFKGKRHMGRPRRRWFRQLLEDEERDLARNQKVKTEDFSTIDHYKMERMVEEEDTEALT